MLVSGNSVEPLGRPILPGRLLAILRRKWACPVLAELADGPKRFVDLSRSVSGLRKAVLAPELLCLIREGLVRREAEPANPRKVHYALTPSGASFCDLLCRLCEWETEHLPQGGAAKDVGGHLKMTS